MTATGHVDRESALLLLRQMLGPKAEFREGQWDAIDLVANQRRRVLVVRVLERAAQIGLAPPLRLGTVSSFACSTRMSGSIPFC